LDGIGYFKIPLKVFEFSALHGDASLNIYFWSYFPLLLFSLKLSVWNGDGKGHNGDLQLK